MSTSSLKNTNTEMKSAVIINLHKHVGTWKWDQSWKNIDDIFRHAKFINLDEQYLSYVSETICRQSKLAYSVREQDYCMKTNRK